jgi:hypothetical protein
MANTFVKIASVTVGSGGAASIAFTSIPSTYTDLVVKISGRNTSSGDWFNLAFNGSTSGFSGKQIFSTGGGLFSYTKSSETEAFVNNNSSTTANTFSNSEVYIPNYAGSTNKSFSVDSVTENNGATAYIVLYAGLWSNGAAITSLTFTPNANTLAQYTTATLYGISNS